VIRLIHLDSGETVHRMPRRPSPRSVSQVSASPRRSGTKNGTSRQRPWMPAWAWALVLTGGLGLMLLIRFLGLDDWDRLRMQAEASSRAGDLSKALGLWRRINAGSAATGATYLGEGRACLAQGLAAQAERVLRRAAAATPGELETWLLLLEILRVEDRPLEAFHLGWEALDAISPEDRPELLRELTLAALTDLPDNLARETLRRWIKVDPGDIDARVALLRRIGAEPRSDDPDRAARLAELSELLVSHPGHVGVREALVTALADAGEPERGRTLLESWPADQRDGRYWRLRGRWNLEHDHQPDQAARALRTALVDFPQDWRTHYRLARALQAVNHTVEAQHEAEAVGRIRELLDPLTLGPRLDASFVHLDDRAALGTLAELCDRAGLTRLAQAWRDIGPVRAGDRPESRGGVKRAPDEHNTGIPPDPANHDFPSRSTFPQGNELGGRATRSRFLSRGCHPDHSSLVRDDECPVVSTVFRPDAITLSFRDPITSGRGPASLGFLSKVDAVCG